MLERREEIPDVVEAMEEGVRRVKSVTMFSRDGDVRCDESW